MMADTFLQFLSVMDLTKVTELQFYSHEQMKVVEFGNPA